MPPLNPQAPPPPSSALTIIDDDALLPPADLDLLETRLAAVFHDGLQRPDAEVCVVLVDDAQIHALNLEWRQVDAPTDVLSFPLQEGMGAEFAGEALGDVVVSIPYAARLIALGTEHRDRVAAQLQVDPQTLHWSLLDEVTFLIIHGVLHLLGHDHALPAEEAVMKSEEARLMHLVRATAH